MTDNSKTSSTCDFEAIVLNANTVKEMVLEQLLNDSIISQEQFEEYNNRHFIIAKKRWYESYFNKFGKHSDEELEDFSYIYTKFD